MLLAIDVYYKENEAKAKIVAVLFNPEDEIPQGIVVDQIIGIKDYVSGEFYKRELPCIESILQKINLNDIEAVIIDGHIYVDDDGTFGLGGYTWESLDRKISPIAQKSSNVSAGICLCPQRRVHTVKKLLTTNFCIILK